MNDAYVHGYQPRESERLRGQGGALGGSAPLGHSYPSGCTRKAALTLCARYPRVLDCSGGMMITRRRLLIAVTLGGLTAPIASLAQQQEPRTRRIGILLLFPLAARRQNWDAFVAALQDLGYMEGRNISIEFVSADGHPERLGELATELVRAKVDLIATSGTESVQAAARATKTIPVVIASMGDPIGAGVVSSLARPGGNVTGMSLLATELSAKRLELLKEMLPGVTRVAILWNPDNASVALKFAQMEEAGPSFGIKVQSIQIRHPGDLEGGIEAAAREHAEAIMDTGDPIHSAYRAKIVDLATRQHLPVTTEFSDSVDAGALFSYGPNQPDLYRRAAGYVDKILKGAKPGDLPIQQPTKLDLVINKKAAKILGLTIPPALLLRADRVVE
jgi:ABC-type uncharacterized transport system substrate-binding protein